MSTLTTTSDDVLIISDERAPERPARSRCRPIFWLSGAGAAVLFGWVSYLGVATALRERWQSQCADNLRQFGRALHQYHEAHDQFPAPAIIGRDGSQLLSWRVAILPQMGYQSLYERFHLDEPWDSPHNRSLLLEMPREFGCPACPSGLAGKTGYLVIVGPEMDGFSANTAFAPSRGAGNHHITDGTSNSLLVLETDRFVPWTKPDDLHWSKGDPLPPVASPHAGGAHMLFADGFVRFIKSTIAPNTLMAVLTINGGEVLGGG